MKNTLHIICIILIGCLTGSCTFGPFFGSAGGSCANIKTSSDYSTPDTEDKSVLTPLIGAGVILPIEDQLSFEGGLLFSGKGSKSVTKSNDGGEVFESENKLKLTYIDIPLVARYQLGESGFSVLGGVQPSILIGAKNKSNYNGMVSSYDVKDQHKAIDIAVNLGVGYRLNNGFRVGVVYGHGLTSIIKSSELGNGGSKAKNRVLSIKVDYLLTKGGK